MPTKSVPIKSGSAHWKTAQSKAKANKRTKLALMVFSVLAALLFLSWAVRFTNSLFSTSKNYLWDGQFSINLLVRSKGLEIFSFSPREEKITMIKLPDNLFLDVPGGFGKWKLGSVGGLGGDQLLMSTVTSLLGIPIDGYVNSNILDDLRASPFSGFSLFSKSKTNLVPWEVLKLKLGVMSVRYDKITAIDLDKLGVLDEEKLPDGTPVIFADSVKLDSVLSSLQDPTIVAERLGIAVLNGTNSPQLANKWARLIANLGGNVIITGNVSDNFSKTEVFGQTSRTLIRLQQIFGKSDKITVPKDSDYKRAQITVILGEDFIGR